MTVSTERLSLVFTGILVTCALVITALVLRRELSDLLANAATGAPPRTIANWHHLSQDGERVGLADAPVRIVVYSDYQCPFCRQQHTILQDIRARFADRVAITFKHVPLMSIHPLARQAALAAECAARQARFEAYHNLLFEHQSRLHPGYWDSLAIEARLPNLEAFRDCMERELPAARIDRHVMQADSLGIRSVPTLVISDRILQGMRPAQELERQILEVMNRQGHR
ncbi:DsbA family protein [Rhodocaloribacter litoris]|uniref:DsbA family protein n=1 Tax=Rhodocaloribacter litoris TaxID=2558931 RepID=UPI00142489C1|nr:thioredoxin domain-containing protein [Rhodocaloribacter litoris]QXD16883.1 DsbA family protein [Rhodocaloribacter litoris]